MKKKTRLMTAERSRTLNENTSGEIEIFEQDKLLTVGEVAKILRVQPCTVIGWVYKRQIPFIKLGIGKQAPLRFNPKALNLWLDNNSMEAGERKPGLKNHQKAASFKRANQKALEDFENFLEKLKEN